MKENMLDILVYLFENYMDDEVDVAPDEALLQTELSAAGFPDNEIKRAFVWLDGLAAQSMDSARQRAARFPGIRVWTTAETDRLDASVRGFLLFLEQTGVLDNISRELVIDRLIALGDVDLDMEELKWVVLMVLFNQPGGDTSFAWKEEMVLEGGQGQLH